MYFVMPILENGIYEVLSCILFYVTSYFMDEMVSLLSLLGMYPIN